MADAYIGEIRIFPYGYAPENWLECNGQSLSISQNQALYAVIGCQYGGSAQSDVFKLPNLQGRVPMGVGQGIRPTLYTLGEACGTIEVTIKTISQVPAHTHTITAKAGKDDPTQTGNAVFLSDPVGADLGVLASRPNSTANYTFVAGFADTAPGTVSLASTTFSAKGGKNGVPQPHNNQQPFQVLRFCICTQGVYPVRP
jgi:microcystin-dependent protein